MNSMQTIILVGALVALLGASGSEAIFGKKKHQQPAQVITNYVPVNQGQPAHYGAEHTYYPTDHHHGAHHGAHHGGHHVAHHGAGHHGAGHHGAGHHASGGAAAATASASAGGAASASASAASAPAAYYEEPHHHVEHHYEPAEHYHPAESHHGHHNACVAPPCYGGLVQNFGVPAPKRQGLVSKLLHKGGHRASHGSHGAHGAHGAHEAHGSHGGYAPQYAAQYY